MIAWRIEARDVGEFVFGVQARAVGQHRRSVVGARGVLIIVITTVKNNFKKAGDPLRITQQELKLLKFQTCKKHSAAEDLQPIF